MLNLNISLLNLTNKYKLQVYMNTVALQKFINHSMPPGQGWQVSAKSGSNCGLNRFGRNRFLPVSVNIIFLTSIFIRNLKKVCCAETLPLMIINSYTRKH